jgi:ElaB/YqjD/DUF883 family membrane-anchored ribosome-binding protein
MAKAALAKAVGLATTAIDVEGLKHRVEESIDDAVHEAERVAKHGKRAVEDAIDDTTYYIKKNPWRSVGYVLGAGVGIGFLTGWLFGRNCREQ